MKKGSWLSSCRFWKQEEIPGRGSGALARDQAKQALAKTEGETLYYESLGEELRRIRERNHFAESIRETMRGEAKKE